MKEALIQSIEIALSEKLEQPVVIKNFQAISGGCINHTGKINTSEGNFFIKWNDACPYPDMPACRTGRFETEAKGLNLLAGANAIKTPEVIAQGTTGKDDWLVLELIEPGTQKNNFAQDFGASLAKLHQQSAEQFGLDHDNYIGSLPQSNSQHDTWVDFFVQERLEKQIALARDEKKIDTSHIRKFNRMYNRLSEIFPVEPPALLHGDLWGGNYMTGSKGEPVLIDPAVYFGYREMDLAMMKLFGGFDSEIFKFYNEAFNLENGWEERLDICNLYPLMVHVNLFGGGYLSSVEGILRKF